MKYLSLFSGIGGFELGIGNKAECIGFSEIDKYAIQVYKNHFPNHKNYGDITAISADALPDFDLICGGFPCQSFSIAGKRGGFNDTRGTLFFDIARIIKVKKPSLLFLENVKGLLSHDRGRTFDTIIRTLDELGYDIQWQVLNSKNHGVPQNRERIFIIGHLRGIPRPQVFPFGETDGKTDDTRIQQINHPKHSNDRVYGEQGIAPTLNTMGGGNRQPFVALTEKRTEEAKEIRKKSMKEGKDFSPRRFKRLEPRTDNKLNTLTAVQSKEHLLSNGVSIRKLTPTECERLQGFPDGWTSGLSDTQRYKCLGNAVTVNVIRDIFLKIKKLP